MHVHSFLLHLCIEENLNASDRWELAFTNLNNIWSFYLFFYFCLTKESLSSKKLQLIHFDSIANICSFWPTSPISYYIWMWFLLYYVQKFLNYFFYFYILKIGILEMPIKNKSPCIFLFVCFSNHLSPFLSMAMGYKRYLEEMGADIKLMPCFLS